MRSALGRGDLRAVADDAACISNTLREAPAVEVLEYLDDDVAADAGGVAELADGGRRLCILKDSRILILDGPTSALDPQTEEHLVNALHEAAKDRIVIVIAHRLSTVAIADRVVFLDHGRVLEQDTHAELMALEDGNYRRFVDLQTTPEG